MTRKITPFLWFDHQAEEAARLYASIFEQGDITGTILVSDAGPGPAGSVMTVSCRLADIELICLNGGPHFQFTPAISLFVGCETEEQVARLWSALADGGTVLMDLGEYPFSKKYGWLCDRFGVSWQISLTGEPQSIAPFLMFTGPQAGRSGAAIGRYVSLFDHSRVVKPAPNDGAGPAVFTLDGQRFMAFESPIDHGFTFSAATSFFIACETQAEIDRLWDALSDGGEQMDCGWVTDAFGVTWQVVPSILLKMIQDDDPAKVERVTRAMLQMPKLEIAGLEAAYAGD